MLSRPRTNTLSLNRTAYTFVGASLNTVYASTPVQALHRRTVTPFTTSPTKMVTDRLAQLTQHLTPINAPGASLLIGQLLKDQVAIITGSGQGIGRSTAILFASHGACVVVSDLDAARSKAVADEITSAGGQAMSVPGNVMAGDFAEKVVKAAVEKWGKINHIVNNAGFTK